MTVFLIHCKTLYIPLSSSFQRLWLKGGVYYWVSIIPISLVLRSSQKCKPKPFIWELNSLFTMDRILFPLTGNYTVRSHWGWKIPLPRWNTVNCILDFTVVLGVNSTETIRTPTESYTSERLGTASGHDVPSMVDNDMWRPNHKLLYLCLHKCQ